MSTAISAKHAAVPHLNERYVDQLRQVIRENVSPKYRTYDGADGMCAPAAEVSARILQRGGHRALVQMVRVYFFNDAALRCLREHAAVGPEYDSVFPGHWSVGTLPPGYHAVTIVDHETLLDASSFQYARPAKGIFVPTPLVGRWDGTRCIVELERGGAAYYQRTGPPGFEFARGVLAELRSPRIRKFIDTWAAR